MLDERKIFYDNINDFIKEKPNSYGKTLGNFLEYAFPKDIEKIGLKAIFVDSHVDFIINGKRFQNKKVPELHYDKNGKLTQGYCPKRKKVIFRIEKVGKGGKGNMMTRLYSFSELDYVVFGNHRIPNLSDWIVIPILDLRPHQKYKEHIARDQRFNIHDLEKYDYKKVLSDYEGFHLN